MIKIENIIFPRNGTKCYVIEDEKENFIIIHGQKYREVINGELYDIIKHFQQTLRWRRLESYILYDKKEGDRAVSKNWWKDLSKEFYNTEIKPISLYKDGEKQEI